MVEFIQYKPSNFRRMEELGISLDSISQIILGIPENPAPNVAKDSPHWAKTFIEREYRACEEIFVSFSRSNTHLTHPASGKICSLSHAFVPKHFSGMTVPVFRVFGESQDRFGLAYCGLTSRVTHIILPQVDCVIYDLDASRAQYAWDVFQDHLASHSDHVSGKRLIGIVDMVTNYAHQAMNHLSGLQRLLESKSADFVDQIWVSGTEFFGRTEDIFPELANKIRHVPQKDIAEILEDASLSPVKIGSNFVTKNLRDRLLALPARCSHPQINNHRHRPLLAITIRTTNRKCVNLPEAVEEIVHGLLETFPDLGVVLDGWTFPESEIVLESNIATALAPKHIKKLSEEMALCKLIADRLPKGVLVGNLVGASTLDSILALNEIDAYFSHVGTLQHKLSWFKSVHGVVHGPKSELYRLESGYYSSEIANPPIFIHQNCIIDLISEEEKDSKTSDYKLINLPTITEAISSCLRINRG